VWTASVSVIIDNVAPSTPAIFKAIAGSTQASLSWSASSDAVTGVAGYRLYRDGVYLGATTATTYANAISANIQYCYTVTAYDALGNTSAATPSVCVKYVTSTPPSTPQG